MSTVPAAVPVPRRMSLGNLVKGRQDKPQRILLYGQEGVGKSTFAAGAPAPIFLPAEDRTDHLDVQRFRVPESWDDANEAVRVLTEEPHEFQTLVTDTLDWLEPLLWAHICRRDNKASIEDYGYGKGYQAALDCWRAFIAALERLRARRGMHIVFVAHSLVKTFKNPEGEDFDRYQLKLHDKAGGLIKEWCDHVLFAAFETFSKKKDLTSKTEKAKGVSTGARLIYTQRTAAYDAKHSGRFPEQLPLSWMHFEAALKASGPMSAVELTAAVEQLAARFKDEKTKTDAIGALGRAAGDAKKLEQLHHWATAKLAEQGA